MAAHDPAARELPDNTIIKVGDEWEVEGHGTRKIERITVCLRPSEDPAGETYGAEVESCEFSLPFVVDLVGGHWAHRWQLLRCIGISER